MFSMAIETLGDAWDAGWRVRTRCAWGKRDAMKSVRECVWSAELDMTTLVATRGRAFPLADMASRLRCPRCGSRRMAVVYDPPSGAGRARSAAV